MDLKGSHILSADQFDKQGLLEFFEIVESMRSIFEDRKQFSSALNGRIMATLFFESSTRTRLSFESAMLKLGGRVISAPDMEKTSSTRKSESLVDTGKVVSKMADVLVVRHPKNDAVQEIASRSEVPVINAGSGTSEHPTQALLDLYTIWKEKGVIDRLKIAIVGDLKFGRTVHSICKFLKLFKVKLFLVSPEELKLPDDLKYELSRDGIDYEEVCDLAEIVNQVEVIMMTRLQEERFESQEEFQKLKGSYVLTKKMMEKAREDAIILHPLPRVDEIAVEVDEDKRAKYFDQVENGILVRMALLKAVLWQG